MDDKIALYSFLPPVMNPATKKRKHLTPYLKSFIKDPHSPEIRGSVLRYTACSTNKWPAPKKVSNA